MYETIFGPTEFQKKVNSTLNSNKRKTSGGKHRLKSSGDIRLEIESDPLGFTYVGPIILGQRKTILDVVYDTGSDWLAVEGSGCSSC